MYRLVSVGLARASRGGGDGGVADVKAAAVKAAANCSPARCSRAPTTLMYSS